MNPLSDNELISLWQKEGDIRARNEVILRHDKTIHLLAYKNKNNNVSEEDLYQEGIILACDTINTYDIESKASFNTFLFLCLKRSFSLVKFNHYRSLVHTYKSKTQYLLYLHLNRILNRDNKFDEITHQTVVNIADELGVDLVEVLEAVNTNYCSSLTGNTVEGENIDFTDFYHFTDEKEDPVNITEFAELVQKAIEKIKTNYPIVAEGIIYRLFGITHYDDPAIIKKLSTKAGVSNSWLKFLIAKGIKEIKEGCEL